MISPIEHSGRLPVWPMACCCALAVCVGVGHLHDIFKPGTGGLKMDLQGAAVTLEDIFTVGGLASPED